MRAYAMLWAPSYGARDPELKVLLPAVVVVAVTLVVVLVVDVLVVVVGATAAAGCNCPQTSHFTLKPGVGRQPTATESIIFHSISPIYF